jgi:hypothetical protein
MIFVSIGCFISKPKRRLWYANEGFGRLWHAKEGFGMLW